MTDRMGSMSWKANLDSSKASEAFGFVVSTDGLQKRVRTGAIMRSRRGQAGPKCKENLVALCLSDLDTMMKRGTDELN